MSSAKFIIISILTIFIIPNSWSQCDSRIAKDISYEVQSISDGSKEINLKIKSGSENLKIQLYDLNEGKIVAEAQFEIDDRYKSAFKDVKPSVYAIYIWPNGCSKPLVYTGEKLGILIEN